MATTPHLEASPPVVALVGPTGSGKSAIALGPARAARAVIVAVDAFTVYRQMTVGTAKPSAADRAAVPHLMVDRLDVEEPCSVSWFQSQARADIQRCLGEGRPVLLVGGSGLYFRAVVDPLEFPPTDPVVRAGITARVHADPAAAYARLAASDPPAAAKIEPGNTRRLTRALEVAELTGRPFSSYASAWQAHRSIYPGLQVIGLDLPREDLLSRIEARVQAMLVSGWVQECQALRSRQLSRTAAQAIGYREVLSWLDQGGDEDGLPSVAERIVIRTRRFGARQRRWFAGDPRVQWVAPDGAPDLLDKALQGRADTRRLQEDDEV